MTSLKQFLIAFAALMVISVAVSGCDDNSKPDMKDAKERVKKMQSFVDIYKSVDGNWDKLTEVQKADLIALQGSEIKAKAGFIGAKEGPMAAQKFLAEARARGEIK